MTNKVLGASTTNGFLGVSPDWANISCPNGRTLQSILTNGTVQYWKVEATQQTGGELLADGNYANPVSVAGNSLDNANAIRAILVSQGLSGEYGYFADGFTLNDPLDVGIDASFQFWKYVGAETLPYAVPQGTDPSAGDWELVKFNLERSFENIYDAISTESLSVLEICNTGLTRWIVSNDGEIAIDNGLFLKAVGGIVYMSDFILDDELSLDYRQQILKAYEAVPQGGKLIYPDYEKTVEIDIPAGQPERPRGIAVTKPMEVVGSDKFITKVKNFCSAWVNYTEVISVYQIESSGVDFHGVAIDANADNHYETDGSGFKYWETGPLSKRPPSGVTIYNPIGGDILEGSVVHDCKIYRPLLGVAINGSIQDANDVDFIDEKVDLLNGKGIVKDCHAYKNKIIRSRGNATQIAGGAIGCTTHNNEVVNPYYHGGRIYFAAINCHIHDNQIKHDNRALSLLYNSTDLGYYRTDNVADPQYYIRRSGVKIGSSFSDTVNNGGNIRNCSAYDNKIYYADNGLNGIVESGDSQYAALHMENVAKSVNMYENDVYNHPTYTSVILNLGSSIPDDVGQYNNRFHNINLLAVIQSDNAKYLGNVATSKNTTASTLANLNGSNIIAKDNTVDVSAYNAQNIFNLTSGSSCYCEGNTGVNIKSSLSKENASDLALGSNAGKNLLTPTTNWTNTSGTIYDNNLGYEVSGAKVTISGTVNSASGSSSQVSTLPQSYLRPTLPQIIQAVVVNAGVDSVNGDIFFGRVSSTGLVTIDKRGLIDIGDLSFSVSYESPNFSVQI